jgi:hypothetical protein
MALALSGTSNGSLNNLSLTTNTGTILDSANTTFFGADQWRLTADIAGSLAAADITTNLERVDNAGFGYIGTGMTESSGIFTFPNTGIWLVIVRLTVRYDGEYDGNTQIITKVTQDNSSYTSVDETLTGSVSSAAAFRLNGAGFILVDVTDVANVKVKFTAQSLQTADVQIQGNTDRSETCFTFMRLGDT